MKQLAYIEFCFKIGKSATETFDLIKLAFKSNVISHCVTFD